MAQELRCPNCGAFHAGTVPKWVSYVKCRYCGASIPVPTRQPQLRQVVVTTTQETTYGAEPKKTFSRSGFAEFVSRKGYAMDSISGVVKMGSAMLYVSEDGTVEGPEPFKTKMERWISRYLEA